MSKKQSNPDPPLQRPKPPPNPPSLSPINLSNDHNNQNCWNCSRMLCGKVYTATNGNGCPYWIERKEDILEDIKVGLGEYFGKIDFSDIFGPKFRIRKFGRIKRRKHKYIPFYFIR